jgi:hypothetical protein
MDDEEYTVISVPGFMTDWRLIFDGKLVVCRPQARLGSGSLGDRGNGG